MRKPSRPKNKNKKSRKDLRGGHIPPIIRQFDKIGRNDACPCGSKKKFKDCHMKDRYDLPRQALVLRNISPTIRAGDYLTKKGEFYVLRGQEKGDHIATFHPDRPWCLRWLKWIVKPKTIKTPNHYSAAHVEMMSDYFTVSINYGKA